MFWKKLTSNNKTNSNNSSPNNRNEDDYPNFPQKIKTLISLKNNSSIFFFDKEKFELQYKKGIIQPLKQEEVLKLFSLFGSISETAKIRFYEKIEYDSIL